MYFNIAVMRIRMGFTRFKALPMLCVGMVCMALAGCVKENNGMRFSIFTEPYNGTTKVAVDGLESTWQVGDRIWVNGVEAAVSLDGSGNPVLLLDDSVSSREGVFYASYPASVVADCTQGGVLSVALPQAYQYHEDAVSGKQLLEMPMVAATRNDQLTFKHLTGALLVRVPKADRNITLDYIMVSSSTSALSGSGTVVLSAASPQVTFGADTSHTVVMYFNDSPVTIPSTATATKDIMIPIAPTAGEHHRFTVTVCAHSTGSTRYYYLFNQESSEGNLARNEVAVAPVPGPLSATTPFLGAGTNASPYLIQNKEDYKRFLYRLNQNKGNDSCYRLDNDIDFGGDTLTSVTLEHGFYGNFEGNGKSMANVSIAASYYQQVYYISLFPSITGGSVRDLSVSNVRLIAPSGSDCYYVYVGGFTSYEKSYNGVVALSNIQVSNITFNYPSSSPSVTSVVVGGLVGRAEENGTGFLTMQACRYFQQIPNLTFDVSSRGKYLFLGGLVGDANGPDVTLTNCQVALGGSQSAIGTTVKAGGSGGSYVGAAIGRAQNNTVTIVTSLLLEGYFQFIGSPNTSVKKALGSSATPVGESYIAAGNLYFWKQANTSSSNYEVTVLY